MTKTYEVIFGKNEVLEMNKTSEVYIKYKKRAVALLVGYTTIEVCALIASLFWHLFFPVALLLVLFVSYAVYTSPMNDKSIKMRKFPFSTHVYINDNLVYICEGEPYEGTANIGWTNWGRKLFFSGKPLVWNGEYVSTVSVFTKVRLAKYLDCYFATRETCEND